MHRDRVRILEVRDAVQHGNVVAQEPVPHHVHLGLHYLGRPAQQVVHRHVGHHPVGRPVERPLPDPGHVNHGFAQRLGGNRPPVHGLSAHVALAVDAYDPSPRLGSLNRRPPPGRTRPDNDDVVVLGLSHLVEGRSFPLSPWERAGVRVFRSRREPESMLL